MDDRRFVQFVFAISVVLVLLLSMLPALADVPDDVLACIPYLSQGWYSHPLKLGARKVPLSATAADILKAYLPATNNDDSRQEFQVFTLTSATLDALFRKARKAAIPACPSIATLRFHDSRSEAISRLSKRLDVLELARMVGHRNLASLMFYYRASAEELAKKLD